MGRFIIEFLEPWAAIRYKHRSQEDGDGLVIGRASWVERGREFARSQAAA